MVKVQIPGMACSKCKLLKVSALEDEKIFVTISGEFGNRKKFIR